MAIAVDIQGLYQRIGKEDVLNDVSLRIDEGEIFGLVGADGSGMEPLMRTIATLTPFQKGKCWVFGHDVESQKKAIREDVGIVHSPVALYPDIKVSENIRFHASIFDMKYEENDPVIAPVYRQLVPFCDRLTKRLSGGMKQKLALCCALIHRPRLLLLENPTTGIDATSRMEFWELLLSLNREFGITIIVSTPYRTEIMKCHRVAMMEHGRITRIGTPTELMPPETPIARMHRQNQTEINVIEVNNLTKRFGNFTAVDSISFSVRKGEIFGFLGANGAGKTTSIQMLCGLQKPSSGKGMVAGFDIVSESDKVRRHIGYMSQKLALYPTLTVKENLMYFGGLYGIPRRKVADLASEKIKQIGLAGMEKQIVGKLALGLQQRVSFAAATLHQPEIIFLDEPTSGVDVEARRQMWEIITTEAERGTTIFVTTHNMDEAMYCDRQSIMVDGQIRAIGNLNKLVESGISPDYYDVYDLVTEAFRKEGKEFCI